MRFFPKKTHSKSQHPLPPLFSQHHKMNKQSLLMIYLILAYVGLVSVCIIINRNPCYCCCNVCLILNTLEKFCLLLNSWHLVSLWTLILLLKSLYLVMQRVISQINHFCSTLWCVDSLVLVYKVWSLKSSSGIWLFECKNCR